MSTNIDFTFVRKFILIGEAFPDNDVQVENTGSERIQIFRKYYH